MLKTGLLSVTFRQRTPQDIVSLCAAAGLQNIEWGGDIHVPPGDLQTARKVAALTRDNGLRCSAYGSYYRLGQAEAANIAAVLDTAAALETSMVRVWAGDRGSQAADAAYRQAVIEDARHVVEQAAQRSITISLEYHSHTLTDTLASTLDLLQTVDSPLFRTFWQPPHTPDLNAKVRDLEKLLPWLTNVHVFHWHPQTRERFTLAQGATDWRTYIDIIATSERDHTLSLEFVRDDAPENFLEDARTLNSWLATRPDNVNDKENEQDA